jgi:hypothetical protein
MSLTGTPPMQKIYRYIKQLSSLLLCLVVFTGQAQEKKIIEKPVLPKVKLYNGFTVQVDAASLVSSAISDGTTHSIEGAVQFNLKKKYYPVIELGYAGADKISNDNVGFKTNGLFERLGFDISMLKQKPNSKPTNNLFTVGLRLGMSNFTYDISNVVITDNYWGGTERQDFSNMNTTKLWLEIVVGIKVEVYKNIFLGWNVRKKILSQPTTGEVYPWYVPGYGINTSGNWDFNYIVGYKF